MIKPSKIISIIIPTRNDVDNLKRLLESINRLEDRDLIAEVVVVNHLSDDNTTEIAKLAGSRVINYTGATVAGARNQGAYHSSGDVLCFLDSDCEPASDFLRVILVRLSREPVVTGSKVLTPQDSSWIEKTWFEVKSRQQVKPVPYINSGNLVVPRTIFDSLGGFNSSLASGEDYEFCLRAKTRFKVIADPSIKVIHHGYPKTLKEFFWREVWHGVGGLSTLRDNPFDKPLVASGIFGLLILAILIGTILRAPWQLLCVLFCSIAFLLVAFAVYRTRSIASLRSLFLSCILAAVYMTARLTAFAYLPFGRKLPYWRNK
jgi:glycosyltransferase involved in cell wall biosynthesis